MKIFIKRFGCILTAVLLCALAVFFHASRTYASNMPAGYWKMDEIAAGSAVIDYSGNSNNGTPGGISGTNNLPQPTSTVPSLHFSDSRSLDFDGTDDIITVNNSSSLDISAKQITMSAWVRTSTDQNDVIIAEKGGWNTGTYQLVLGDGSTNSWPKFNLYSCTSPVDSTTSIADNAWHHLAGVYDGSFEYIYVDGVLKATSTCSSDINSNTGPLTIGARYNQAGHNFKGEIDDLRIYSQALTSVEISDLAAGNSGLAVPSITLSAATSTATSTAIIGGNITSTGGDTPDVTVYWGTIDGGTATSSWANSFDLGTQGVTAFSKALTGLTPDTTYYFSAKATNSAGTSWPAASLSFATLSDVLIAYWKLDSNGTDSSGYGNNLTVTGGAYSANHPNVSFSDTGSIYFNGTTDHAQSYNASLFNFGSAKPISESFWIKTTSTPASSVAWIIALANAPGDNSTGYGNGVYLDSSGYPYYYNWNSGAVTVNGTSTVADGNWHHVATTYDGSHMRLYIDGVQRGGSVPYSLADAGTSYVVLSYGHTGMYRYAGLLDDVRIYNRALSQDEISNLATIIISHTLAYAAGDHGSVSGSNPQTVNNGSSGSAVTAVADTGYHFVDWSDRSTQNPRTDTNVTGDISVTANFAADEPSVPVSRGGSVYPSIYGINASLVTATTAVISWKTDFAAGSEVNYGTSTAYGLIKSSNTSTTTHVILLDNLAPGTAYWFMVKSGLNGITSWSSSQTFTTLSAADSGTSAFLPPVAAASTSSGTSPLLRLINDNGTFYLVENGLRYGVANPGILYSYGFDFKDGKIAATTDLSLPLGTLLPPGDGYLVKSETDKTVCFVSNRQRYAFVSAEVFTALGFSFNNILIVTDPELRQLPLAGNISDPQTAHPAGVDIVKNGTVYYSGSDNRLHPYPSLDIYNSWHRDNGYSTVLPANAADLALPLGDPMQARVMQ